MAYPDQAYTNGASPVSKVSSRIDSEIERVKTLTNIVNSSTSRVTRHAHSLGFFEPSKAESNGLSAPVPVSISLSDALDDLLRAIDRNSGALNLFD